MKVRYLINLIIGVIIFNSCGILDPDDNSRPVHYSKSQIYSVNIDGTNNKFISDGYIIGILYDQNRMVYEHGSSLSSKDFDGQNNKILIDQNKSGSVWSANLSNDGKKIALSIYMNGNADIWSMNIDGSGLTRITNTPNLIELQPEFSPDNSEFIFEVDKKIFKVDSDGENYQEVVSSKDSLIYLHPKYLNPDYILFWDSKYNFNDTVNFHLYNLKTKQDSIIFSGIENIFAFPNYQIKNNKILFLARENFNDIAYIYNYNINEIIQIGKASNAVFSNDGNIIVYSHNKTIYLKNLITNESTIIYTLAEKDQSISELGISNDNRTIIYEITINIVE